MSATGGGVGKPCAVCGHYLNVFACTPEKCNDPDHAKLSRSYHKDCCSSDCDHLGANPAEPCWGAVVGIGDDYDEESNDEWRHHACEGHRATDEGGAYVPEPAPAPAAPMETLPFIASRPELGHPSSSFEVKVTEGKRPGDLHVSIKAPTPIMEALLIPMPTDRYIVRAVRDADTCPTCRDADGVSVLVPAGQAPTLPPCEHAMDADDVRECRCVLKRVSRPTRIQDGLVPLGPLDTYNGVKVSALCIECRDGIARYEHGMQASVTLCPTCSDKIATAEVKRMDAGTVHVTPGGERIRDAIRETPAVPDHPPPWRWGPAGYPKPDEFGRPETLALYDANGAEIIGTDGGDWSWVDVASPRVKALIQAAPDMEAMLRSLLVDLEKGGASTMGKAWHARIQSLLADIDERSKRIH